MHPKQPSAPVIRQSTRCGSDPVAVLHGKAGDRTQEPLSTGTDEDRAPQCLEGCELIEQQNVLLDGLGKPESRIDDRSLEANAGCRCARQGFAKLIQYHPDYISCVVGMSVRGNLED